MAGERRIPDKVVVVLSDLITPLEGKCLIHKNKVKRGFMTVTNRLAGVSLMLLASLLIACTPHSKEPQRLTMRNPASEYCVNRGGQQVQEKSSAGITTYCLLPSGERIEQWALYHRDHLK